MSDAIEVLEQRTLGGQGTRSRHPSTASRDLPHPYPCPTMSRPLTQAGRRIFLRCSPLGALDRGGGRGGSGFRHGAVLCGRSGPVGESVIRRRGAETASCCSIDYSRCPDSGSASLVRPQMGMQGGGGGAVFLTMCPASSGRPTGTSRSPTTDLNALRHRARGAGTDRCACELVSSSKGLSFR